MKAYIFTERDDIPSTYVNADDGFGVYFGRPFKKVIEMPRLTMADHVVVRDSLIFVLDWCDVDPSPTELGDGLQRIADNPFYAALVRESARTLKVEVLDHPTE